MGLRKALSYSKNRARPYTRNSRRKDKSYIKTIPANKVVKYFSGNQKDFQEGKYTHGVHLVSEERVQIRDNALEACRMFLTKMLDEEVPGEYFLVIKVHPHHLLRENKSAAAVAGADRISTGMTQSFGVVIGRAALVRPGQTLLYVACLNERAARVAKLAMHSIKSKVPCSTKIVFEKLAVAA